MSCLTSSLTKCTLSSKEEIINSHNTKTVGVSKGGNEENKSGYFCTYSIQINAKKLATTLYIINIQSL